MDKKTENSLDWSCSVLLGIETQAFVEKAQSL